MALRYIDGFDTYTTLTQRWTIGTDGSIIAGAARTGAAGYRTGNVASRLTMTIDAQGTWILGVGFRTSAIGAHNTGPLATVDSGTVQGDTAMTALGVLTVKRGATVVATGTTPLLANVYYYLEFKHIIANAAGTLELRVNGAVNVTFAGDTQETANATANQIAVGGGIPGGVTTDYDDLYILDGQAGLNDYLGDRQVAYGLASGVGNSAQWTPSAGANWQNVDEAAPDDDTTYNSSATATQKDTFAFTWAGMPASSTVDGIQIGLRLRDEAAGVSNIHRIIYEAPTENNGAEIDPGTSYATVLEILENDPIAGGGGSPFTRANLLAAEFGYGKTT